jgi:hypothetical protein
LGKIEIGQGGILMRADADSSVRRRARLKKACWFLAGLAAAIIALVLLLFYRPARYDPLEPVRDNQVSPYLTHELLPRLYNDSQLGEPFDLLVSQYGINDIISRYSWPKEFDGITFSAPEVLFLPDGIVLMGTAAGSSVELVITMVVEPSLDQQGLLSLHLAKVKVGAVNITLLVKMMGKRAYNQRLAEDDIDTENIRAKIAASLLNDEPFEPTFDVEERKVRVENVTLEQGNLTLHLAPVPD